MDELDMNQCGCPHGEEGRMVLAGMNEEHKPRIEWAIENLPDIHPKTILDIGCGGGIFTRLILQRYPDAKGYAIDISEISIEYSEEYNKDLVDSGHLELTLGNVEDMPYDDGQFDLIVSNASFMFWPDLGENLKEVARVMNGDGGVLCMTCGKSPEEVKSNDPIANMFSDDIVVGYMTAAGLDTYCLTGEYRSAYIGVKRI